MAYATGRRIVGDGAREPAAVRHHDARRLRECDRRRQRASAPRTNCPPHIIAIARHMGVELTIEDWERHRPRHPAAGRLPAGRPVPRRGLPPRRRRARGDEGAAGRRQAARRGDDGDRQDAAPRTCATCRTADREVIRAYDAPMKAHAGFAILSGNIFDSAVMKISVIDEEFRRRFLSEPAAERLRGQGRGVRGAGGLPRPHRGPVARHRRAYRAGHPQLRPGRLSRQRRGGEHAAAGGAAEGAASTRCRPWATGGSPAPRAAPRSSTSRRKPRSAAAWRC